MKKQFLTKWQKAVSGVLAALLMSAVLTGVAPLFAGTADAATVTPRYDSFDDVEFVVDNFSYRYVDGGFPDIRGYDISDFDTAFSVQITNNILQADFIDPDIPDWAYYDESYLSIYFFDSSVQPSWSNYVACFTSDGGSQNLASDLEVGKEYRVIVVGEDFYVRDYEYDDDYCYRAYMDNFTLSCPYFFFTYYETNAPRYDSFDDVEFVTSDVARFFDSLDVEGWEADPRFAGYDFSDFYATMSVTIENNVMRSEYLDFGIPDWAYLDNSYVYFYVLIHEIDVQPTASNRIHIFDNEYEAGSASEITWDLSQYDLVAGRQYRFSIYVCCDFDLRDNEYDEFFCASPEDNYTSYDYATAPYFLFTYYDTTVSLGDSYSRFEFQDTLDLEWWTKDVPFTAPSVDFEIAIENNYLKAQVVSHDVEAGMEFVPTYWTNPYFQISVFDTSISADDWSWSTETEYIDTDGFVYYPLVDLGLEHGKTYNFVIAIEGFRYQSIEEGESYEAWVAVDFISRPYFAFTYYDLPTAEHLDGYYVEGWYYDADFTLPYVLGTPTTAELYTNYVPVEYSITYYLDGGEFTTPPRTSFTIESYVVLPTPTKEGYAFEGWYTLPDFGGYGEGFIDQESGNRYYFAKWRELDMCEVTFIVDGGVFKTINVPAGTVLV